jgi:hypothetical protein
MQELRSLETSVLVDMLVTQTDKYKRMLSEGTSHEDYARCSLMIKALQAELDFRRRKSANASTSDSNIILPE